ncbi:MAG TPA: DUF4272 domain-containing protein, partial [Labilithrix sp.]
MSDVVRKVEVLLEALRREPAARTAEIRDAVHALVVSSGEPAAIRARIAAELDGTEDEAYWGALDALLERVPPASDWILQGDVYRPGERSVIARAIALGALIQQYEYERLFRETREDADPETPDEDVIPPDLLREARRHRWLALTKLAELSSDEEREMLDTEPGTWTDAQCADASWRTEAFGVLAWALGLLPRIPRWDEPFDDDELLDAYEELLESTAVTQLRGWDEIDALARRATDWHARVSEVDLRASRPEPEGELLFGKSWQSLDDEELDVARSIAYQRRY